MSLREIRRIGCVLPLLTILSRTIGHHLLILLVLYLLNIFSLVTISEPVVKIVSEFFEDVHVVSNSSTCLTILSLVLASIFQLDSASLRCQFGCVTKIIHISTLNLTAYSSGTIAICTHICESLAVDGSVHIVMVAAVGILIKSVAFIRTILGIIMMRSSNHWVICIITLNLVVSNLIH